MDDSLVDKYKEKLENSSNTSAILTAFLFEVHEQEFKAELIPTIARLNKLYGTMNVFYSICDSAFVENLVLNKDCVRLLAYFCIKRASKDDIPADINLKEISKRKPLGKRKLKLPKPFEEKLDE